MSAPYYILKPAVDTQETGSVFPAVETYPDYDFKGPNSMHKLKFRSKPNFEPDIRFKLAKGARLTDMLGQAAISAHGFLVSEKLKTFFVGIKMIPFEIFPAIVEDSAGQKHKYFWVHFFWDTDYEFIDWENSEFIIKKFSRVEGQIKLSSFNHYVESSKKIGKLQMIKYTRMSIFPIPYQIFTIPIGTEIICQQETYTKLSNQFSGVSLNPAEIISQI